MHESTPTPSSPSRMSLNPCSGEHIRLELGEASKVASGATNEGPITVQGDGDETDGGLEKHKAATPGNVGDEGLSVVDREDLILSEQPAGFAEGVGDDALSTSVGGERNANTVPEQHEVVTLEVAEVIGAAALKEMTEGARDEGLDTIRRETVEESSGAGFELDPPEMTTDMVIVSSGVTPPAEVTLVTTTSMVTLSDEVAPVPVSSLTMARSSEDSSVAVDMLRLGLWCL
ncbi:hypothetical protein AMTR_s00096p00156740 [Amborella trichopoda]|uniref:Uncharacterized protein n=1 Tax=Amborella trichopoda TaxID=13333 RepID=W1P451_AMBTC|nr:hypothetical protein AMTR_s00096p00156740 [Amborella trichopoda]